MKKKVRALKEQGYTNSEISKKLKINPATVTYHLYSDLRKEKLVHKQTNRRKANKEKLIAALGSKCEICGYSRCVAALDFHHRNTSEKEFELGDKMRMSLTTLLNEVSKCALLCSNCHREVHAGLISL